MGGGGGRAEPGRRTWAVMMTDLLETLRTTLSHLQGPSQRGSPQYGGISLQGLIQVPTVSVREKSLPSGGGQKNLFKTQRAFF